MQIDVCKWLLARLGGMLIYVDSDWPLWLRVLITLFAAGLVAILAWRYYTHFWRRR
jgi:hypothetical protein